jgi:hypothetical protein
MKRIRLKNEIKIIEFCTSLNCPCYECWVDSGEERGELGASCNLGATIQVDENRWPIKDGVFPDDCPLEDAEIPSKKLTDEERNRILKFIEDNKANILDVPTIKQSFISKPQETGYIESVPTDEVQVIIRMRLPLAGKKASLFPR